MRKALVVAACVLSASLAFGALGDIIASFPAPANSPRGLARAAAVLFCLDYNSPNRVYRLNPTTGSITGSWLTPYNTGNRGLAYVYGGYVYVGCWSTDYIYRCDSGNGSVYSSFAAGHDPQGLAPNQTGDGGSGATELFCSATSPSYFWRHHYTTGSIAGSFAAPHTSYNDIAYDWRNHLIWRFNNSSTIFGITTAGSVAASFAWSGHGSYAGITYDNQYLYVSADTQDYIYQIHCPNTVGVAPSSLGRVKAIYK